MRILSRKKINSMYEFTMDLNMEEYTELFNMKQDIGLRRPKSYTADEFQIANLNFPPEYYAYDLKGIVLHSGTTEAGHYTSLVCDDPHDRERQEWYEFNDSIVNKIDSNTIFDEAFGGTEEL